MNHTAALAIFALLAAIVITVTAALTTAPHALACLTAKVEQGTARTPAELVEAIRQRDALCRK